MSRATMFLIMMIAAGAGFVYTLNANLERIAYKKVMETECAVAPSDTIMIRVK